MSDDTLVLLPVTPPPAPRRSVRVEYLDFRDVDAHREFRFHVYGPDGPGEIRIRIANTAFEAGRVRRQDGPDLCYQKLLGAIAAGASAQPEVSTVDDGDLLKYRDDHTVAPKRRPRPTPSPAPEPAAPRRQPQYRPSTPRTASPEVPATTIAAEPVFVEGQRVKHAVFGLGVTTGTTGERTVISFDSHGPRSFVTSMLEVEVLSEPHTWSTSPRGVNRPREPLGPETGSRA